MSFNKQDGFFRFIYLNDFAVNVHARLSHFYVYLVAVQLVHAYENYLDLKLYYFSSNPGGLTENYNYYKDLNIILKFFFFNADVFLFSKITPPYWIMEGDVLTVNDYKEVITLKYLDTLLFNTTNWGYFYFGRKTKYDSIFSSKYSPFLTVQQFKHSTLLEVIWATFPSVLSF